MKKIIDVKTKRVVYTKREDILVEVDGEIQHHYITLDWLSTQREEIIAINEYVDLRVHYRGLSEEQQKLERLSFERI